MCYRHQPHPVRIQEACQLMEVSDGSGKPVQFIDENYIEAPPFNIRKHPLILWTILGGTGKTCIYVYFDDFPSHRCSVGTQSFFLQLEGNPVNLLRGRDARVKGGAHAVSSSTLSHICCANRIAGQNTELHISSSRRRSSILQNSFMTRLTLPTMRTMSRLRTRGGYFGFSLTSTICSSET